MRFLLVITIASLAAVSTETAPDKARYPGVAKDRVMTSGAAVRNLTTSRLSADWSLVRPQIHPDIHGALAAQHRFGRSC